MYDALMYGKLNECHKKIMSDHNPIKKKQHICYRGGNKRKQKEVTSKEKEKQKEAIDNGAVDGE